jgi:hypothetical protein
MPVTSALSTSPVVFCYHLKREQEGETMLPPSRFGSKAAALLLAALLLVGSGAARAEAPTAPAAPPAAPQVNKTTIYNGLVPTVTYSVQGGSPHLQALVQTLQFTENEINLTGELQKLRLGIVANEQILDSVRTSQVLGLGPLSTPASCYSSSDSALKSALIPGLAREATPAAAYGLINMWEQALTGVQAEQARAGVVEGVPPANPIAQPAAPVAEAPVPIQHLGAAATGALAARGTLGRQLPMPGVGFTAQARPQFPSPMNPQEVSAFQQMVRDRIARAQQQMLARR